MKPETVMTISSTVCALVPTYNRARYIGSCINSLLAQPVPPAQIIVINDGSTDETVSVVSALGNRVTLITKENGGKASALNLGMEHCTSDYVWICDDDDLAAPNGLNALVHALDSDPEASIAFGRYLTFSDSDAPGVYHEPRYWARPEEANPKINFLEGMFTNQFAMLVRKSLYEATGPFREDMIRSQDFEMTQRLMRHAKAVYVPEIIFYYRQHEGARGSSADKFSSSENTRKWLTYEQKVVSFIRVNYALEEFCPGFAAELPSPLKRRACLLERSLVSANRALWLEAAADLAEAASLSATPASAEEIRLAGAVIRTSLPWQVLATMPEARQTLGQLGRSSGFVHSVLAGLSQLLVWDLRKQLGQRRFKDAAATLGLMISVLGLTGTLKRLGQSFLGKFFS